MTDEFLPLLLLAPVLLIVAVEDLRRLTISNRLVLLALILFGATAPFLAPGEILWRAAAGLSLFAVLIGFFALGMLGGGDVKMLPAVVLFVPSAHWGSFATLLALTLLLGVIGVIGARSAATRLGPTGWLALDRPGTFPMGVSIAGAGLLLPALSAIV